MKLRALAPAKVNLSLFLGATREDGRHRLVTVFESLSLADVVELETVAPGGDDIVVCPGVTGENLAAWALAAFRARGWDGPPVRVSIDKRIPIAAGMAGGSADAAAVLRLAMAVSDPARAWAEEVDAVAAGLGADVPAQLLPGVSVGTGAGEIVERFEKLAEHAFVVLPSEHRLSTPDVFREADRLRPPRSDQELALLYRRTVDTLTSGTTPSDQLLVVNDLQPAAVSLCPWCAKALAAAREAGANHALVSGSGPTVVGILWGADAAMRAAAVAEVVRNQGFEAVVATPMTAESAAPALI